MNQCAVENGSKSACRDMARLYYTGVRIGGGRRLKAVRDVVVLEDVEEDSEGTTEDSEGTTEDEFESDGEVL